MAAVQTSGTITVCSQCAARRGIDVRPEVMIPLVATVREFDDQAAIVRRVARDVLDQVERAVAGGTR